MNSKRLCIYPKDIQRITGKSERYGRMLIEKIKLHFKKDKHQFLTIQEFCEYSGLKYDDVSKHIND